MKKGHPLYKILAVAMCGTMFLPFCFLRSHHDCRYDECFRIFYNDKMGVCVENAIDNICSAISIAWWFITIGGLIVLNKNKSAVSPFVIMGLTIILAVSLSFVDPAKWVFVLSLLPSLAIMITVVIIDSRDALHTRQKTEGQQ